MSEAFADWVGALRSRAAAVCVFSAAFLFSLILVAAVPALGQISQVPSLGTDDLSQLQQQFSQRGGQTSSGTTGNFDALQPLTLQPAVPPRDQRDFTPSRLEAIMSARAGAKLQQFGYDQIGRGRAVTIPQTGAVQDDYTLGPGDEVVIWLRGQENNRFDVIVDRNGQIVIPRLPPIPATGRSFGSVRDDISAAVHRAYVATDASVSIGRVRQISVLVSGEVNNPGQRILTGLSSAVDALLLSGGVKKTGSLRNVRIQRGAHEYNVDLYNVLTDRGSSSSMRLADGDRILVPPLGPTVAVTGLVRQPGIFELASRTSSISTRALLALAGGQEVRGLYRLSLLHILQDGRTDMVQLSGETGTVRDSEILFVQLGADRTTSRATLVGGTALAGTYPVVTGAHLSEILKAPGALGSSPYMPFGIIIRKDAATLMPTLIAFTPTAVLAGREDIVLQGDDVVRPLATREARLLDFVTRTYVQNLARQQGEIRNPLARATDTDNTLTKQLQERSGQDPQGDDVSGVPANVQRQEITLLLDRAAPGSALAARRDKERRADERAAKQQQLPGLQQEAQGNSRPRSQWPPSANQIDQTNRSDRVAQTDQTDRMDQTDQPDQPDQTDDVQKTRDEDADQNTKSLPRNFTDQSVDAGSFASNREVETFGQLARQIDIDPLVLVNFLVDHRMRLDGAVRGPGFYFVGPSATLADLIQAAGGPLNSTDESGVELISTTIDRASGHSFTRLTTLAMNQGTLASYIIKPHDTLRFGQVFSDAGTGSVTVQGQVRHPGNFPIIRGEHLSDVLARAGGLTNVAYPYGTVFLRQSAAQQEREGYNRAADEVQNQLVIAMTRIGNDKISPDTFTSMQTFVEQLRNQKALGRISIAADPSVLAANPALDPLLEPGDVIFIPQRSSTVSVLGQVLRPGTFPHKPGQSLGDYISQAGGYSTTADESQTFIVLPDGTARRTERSWLTFSADTLPPGSTVVVPRDVTPLDLRQTVIDVSQIFSQFAVAIASVAVLSKQ